MSDEGRTIGGKVRPCIVVNCQRSASGSMEVAFDSPSGIFGTVNLPACVIHRPDLLQAYKEERLLVDMGVSLDLLPEGETIHQHPYYKQRSVPVPGSKATS